MRTFRLTSGASRTLTFLAILILTGGVTQVPQAHAGKAELDRLLNKRKRPTIQEVIRAAGRTLSDRNPYEHYFAYEHRHDERLESYEGLPRVIAFMEKAFPGAIWAPLGRDAVIFGDLLDAFYISIGQPGRVVRLNASGASFRRGGNEMRAALLESAGLDMDAVLSKRPLVGMDRTGYGPSSQSTNLIRAGYEAYARAGGDPKDLVHKLNFLGLQKGTVGKDLDAAKIRDYFNSVRVRGSPASLDSIMQLNVGRWTDGLSWHDTFGTLQQLSDGRVEGAPGVHSDLEDRKAILAEMIQIIKKVSKPGFLAAVQNEAHDLGYEFAAQKTQYAKLLEQRAESEAEYSSERAPKFEEANRRRFRTLTESLEPLSRDYSPKNRSRNGERISEWLTSAMADYLDLAARVPEAVGNKQANYAPLYLIRKLTGIKQKNLISRADYLYLLSRALSEAEIDADYLKAFERIYDEDPTLKRAISRDADVLLSIYRQERLPGTEHTNRSFRRIREFLGNPVDCEQIFGPGGFQKGEKVAS